MIQVKNLQKTFLKDGHRIEVLKGLDFEIAEGESLAVVGVSGAGKSTLIHIIGTLDHPTSGAVLFDGVDVFTWPEKKLAAFRTRKIGFVFQFHNLLPEFTALENAMMPALIQRIPKGEAKQRAEAILGEVGLGDRITHKPGELSGGEQQRVALARALILEPEILLADEPTGSLDAENAIQLGHLLAELNREYNLAVVVVTHSMAIASLMGKIYQLSSGKLQLTDKG